MSGENNIEISWILTLSLLIHSKQWSVMGNFLSHILLLVESDRIGGIFSHSPHKFIIFAEYLILFFLARFLSTFCLILLSGEIEFYDFQLGFLWFLWNQRILYETWKEVLLDTVNIDSKNCENIVKKFIWRKKFSNRKKSIVGVFFCLQYRLLFSWNLADNCSVHKKTLHMWGKGVAVNETIKDFPCITIIP